VDHRSNTYKSSGIKALWIWQRACVQTIWRTLKIQQQKSEWPNLKTSKIFRPSVKKGAKLVWWFEYEVPPRKSPVLKADSAIQRRLDHGGTKVIHLSLYWMDIRKWSLIGGRKSRGKWLWRIPLIPSPFLPASLLPRHTEVSSFAPSCPSTMMLLPCHSCKSNGAS
jgi:hypothetical protein